MSGPEVASAQRLRRSCFLFALLLAAAVVQVSCDDDGSTTIVLDADMDDGGDTSDPDLGDTDEPDTTDTEEPDTTDTADADDTSDADGVDGDDTDTVDPCEGLPNLCDTAGTACNGDVLTTCAQDANGCLVETTMDCNDGAGGFCDDTGATAMCGTDVCFGKTLCDTAGATCDGDVLTTCMLDTDGCLVEMQMDCAQMTGGFCDTSGGTPQCSVDPCEGLPNLCTTPGTACNGDVLETCAQDANGCLVQTTMDCNDGAGGFCNAAAPAACDTDPCFGISDCTTPGVVCNGDTLEECAADANGCLVTTTTDCTLSGGACDATGATPVCTGLACADQDIGSVTGTPAIQGDNTGAGDDFLPQAGDCFGSSPGVGNDLAYVWTAPQDGCFQIDTENSTGLSDSVLKVLDNCVDRGELACDEDSATSPDLNSLVRLEATSGEPYIIVVDSYNTTFDGAFDLNIERVAASCTETLCTDGTDDDGDGLADCADPDCTSLPACATACTSQDLGSVVGDSLATGTNVGAGADGRTECGGDGEDIAFAWTAPTTGCFQFDTIGSTYDSLLEIRDTCFATGLACDREEGAGNSAVFKYDVTAGQEYVLWLDSWASATGDYVININPSPTPCTETVCTGGTDEDADGLTDCEDPDCFGVVGACDVEALCGDGQDNDGDGLVDCADSDCGSDPLNGCTCGDGILGSGTETCDDGNTTPADGCSATCQAEAESCANAFVIPSTPFTWTTGPWTSVTHDYEYTGAGCESEPSGEGELVFQIDVAAGQGLVIREDGPWYGNYNIQTGACGEAEACVFSFPSSTSADEITYVSPTAQTLYVHIEAELSTEADPATFVFDLFTPGCGNGILEAGEVCDDGNTVSGDGCSAACDALEGESCAAPILVSTFPYQSVLPEWQSVAHDHELIGTDCVTEDFDEPDYVFQVDLLAGQALLFAELNTSFDSTLSIQTGACGDAATCVQSNKGAEETGIGYIAPADETVYLVIESEYSFTTGQPEVLIDIVTVACGNGTIEPGETCDDGNASDGDGCSATCQFEGESCADPIIVPNNATYQLTGPNFGFVGDDLELNPDHCIDYTGGQGELVFQVDLSAGQTVRLRELDSMFAVLSVLPGVCDATTACAARSTDEAFGVTYTAIGPETIYLVVETSSTSEDEPFDIIIDFPVYTCGDGVIESGEECDDNNVAAGDGCSDFCQLEGESCTDPVIVNSQNYQLQGVVFSSVSDDLVLDAATCEEEDFMEGELIFRVDMLAGETLSARELESSFVGSLSIVSDPCASAICVASTTDEETGLTYQATTNETVYVVLEATSQLEYDEFDIRIDVVNATCGNLVVEPGEQCDDGNTTPGDGCNDTCQIEGESCAAPLILTGPSATYTVPSFDVFLDDHELDGAGCQNEGLSENELVFQMLVPAGQSLKVANLDSGWDGNINIQTTGCGNLVDCAISDNSTDETAFYNNISGADETVFIIIEEESSSEADGVDLTFDVFTPGCGNNVVEPLEACDDGNTVAGDGCSATCTLEGETCAAPVVVTTSSFRLTGATWSGVADDIVLDEASCDEEDGGGEGDLVFQVNLTAGQSVWARELESSFSGTINIVSDPCTGLLCLSSNFTEDEGVTYLAQTDETVYVVLEATSSSEADGFDLLIDVYNPVCGDGLLEPGEWCDDNNTLNGDGCSDICEIEAGTCAAPIVVTTSDYQLFGTRWDGITDDLQLDATTCAEETAGEGDLVFQVDLLAGETVFARELESAFAGTISIVSDPCAGVICLDSQTTEDDGAVYTASANETVYVVLESTSATEDDAFDVRIEKITPICGDGIADPGEPCDDGNSVTGDGCSPQCELEGESCAEALAVTGDTLIVSGPTFDVVQDDQTLSGTSCNAEPVGNGELVFSITLAANEGVRVFERGPGFSAAVSIMSAPCTDASLCLESSTADDAEYISTTGETVYIIVEEEFEDDDPYFIEIQRFTAEVCGDTLDNDRDGLIDCDDSDCFGTGSCAAFEANCLDGEDNDGDTTVDCLDVDCAANHACQPVTGVYEYFSSSTTDPFDLVNYQIVYTPDGTGDYTWTVQPIAAFDTVPGTGLRTLSPLLADDESLSYALSLFSGLPFYNGFYNTVFISDNGYVTFGQPDSGYNTSDSTHFAYARIAGVDETTYQLYGGTLTIDEFTDRLVLTYEDWHYDSSVTDTEATFQITMFGTGEIRVAFLENTHSSSGTGISSGGTGSTYPAQVDFFTPTPTP